MKISKNCFAVTGLYFYTPWTVNTGFIAGNARTLFIDSGANYLSAQTIYGYGASVKGSNDFILINTEKHFDHIGGNCYFAEKHIPIYGHSKIQRSQKDFNEMILSENDRVDEIKRKNNKEALIPFRDTKIVNPDWHFTSDFNIDLGNIQAKILLTPGHTETNISVYCPSDKVLYCGDCVLRDFLPNTSEGDINQWIASLEKIETLGCEIIVPGHGNVIIGKENIAKEINRIKKYISDQTDITVG